MAGILAKTRVTVHLVTTHMGSIRITGGHHRSRKISVLDSPGLRPTADRVREVLFNWVGHQLDGLAVLDLFAGTGILGLEAASRGAKSVTWVDNNRQAINHIRAHCEQLQIEQGHSWHQDALAFCQSTQKQWDLIFLDPPFAADLMDPISAIMPRMCQTGGLLYREYASAQTVKPLDDPDWHLLKSKKMGQVNIELWQRQ